MKTIKFNENETFELWHALRKAIWHEEKNLDEWNELNKEGGYQSMIEETTKSIEILSKTLEFITYCNKIKIEGD